MFLNEFLVAAQFGGMVSADALVVVGCGVVVEGADGQVKYAMIGILVLQNLFVGR